MVSSWQIGLIILFVIGVLYYMTLCRPMTAVSTYWTDLATAAGIDINKYKLSYCKNQWYVNGKTTGIGAGGWNEACPINLVCAGTGGNIGLFGYGSQQMDLVKKFIDGVL